MLDYIAYIAIKALNKIFSLIPISVSLWIARRAGTLAFAVNRKRRVIAYANLKAAFAGEKSPHELRLLTKKVYQNLIQTVVEILNLTKLDKEYKAKYVNIVNVERLHNGAKSKRGVILLTAHFGDWELSSLVSALIGYPLLVLAREQKMGRVNELLNRLRESKGCKVIRKGFSMKNIVRALKERNVVGILSDQDAGKNGVFVEFFGRPASCHVGPMEMAKRTDSIIIPNFIIRRRGPYHDIVIEEPVDFRMSPGGEDDVIKALQKFTALLESYIRRYPEQWLWLHKRWKSTPARTILVLNDGRHGHLNQSLGIAREIQRARMLNGYTMDQTRIITVDVKFKNAFARRLLSLCALFATWRCQGCMRCMRVCLEKDSYEELMKAYSDFVISCGSSLAGVNVFMSKENNAKNIAVMKPDIIPLNKFNLAILPRHDRPPARRNVIETAIAPNLIDEASLKDGVLKLSKEFSLKEGDDYIGLLIGGDNPEFALTEEVMAKVIDAVSGFCEEKNAGLLVTTSRRTNAKVETLLKARLNGKPYCKLLIIATENNPEGAIAGILGLSRIAVVSAESISMVSEAISSGKKTVAFKLQKRTNAPAKHERALEGLSRDGCISLSAADDLADIIRRSWNDALPAAKNRDREKIFEAVTRLI